MRKLDHSGEIKNDKGNKIFVRVWSSGKKISLHILGDKYGKKRTRKWIDVEPDIISHHNL